MLQFLEELLKKTCEFLQDILYLQCTMALFPFSVAAVSQGEYPIHSCFMDDEVAFGNKGYAIHRRIHTLLSALVAMVATNVRCQ